MPEKITENTDKGSIQGKTVSGNGESTRFQRQNVFDFYGLEQVLYHSSPQFLHLTMILNYKGRSEEYMNT